MRPLHSCTCREPIGTADKLVVYDKWNVSLSNARASSPSSSAALPLFVSASNRIVVVWPQPISIGSNMWRVQCAKSRTTLSSRAKPQPPPPTASRPPSTRETNGAAAVCRSCARARAPEGESEKKRSCLLLFPSLAHSLSLRESASALNLKLSLARYRFPRPVSCHLANLVPYPGESVAPR